jgi:hypothetical protein
MLYRFMWESAMDESTIRVQQSGTELVAMLNLSTDEQLVDLAIGFGREKDYERCLLPSEYQRLIAIKAELLFRLRNSRSLRSIAGS